MSIIIPANTLATGGYDVENSLRFNFGSSDYLNLTAAGNSTLSTKGTWSTWIKKSNPGSSRGPLFSGYADASNRVYMVINADALTVFGKVGGTVRYTAQVDQFNRDPSAWMNIVVAIDTTQGTAANRIKIYINGTAATIGDTNTAVYPVQDTAIPYAATSSYTNLVGALYSTSLSQYLDGYLAETVFVDGLALNQNSFGEFDSDSNIWKPIDVSGLTFGDNGFYLEYKGSGTSANASGLGADTSGNTSHFTVNNLTTVDQSTDTCTNNFATLNPLYQQGDNAFSEGNCKVVLQAGDGTKGVASNIAVSSGKWYFEVKQGSSTNSVIQVREASDKEDDLSYYEGSYAGYQFNNGNQYITGNSSSAYGASYADGDIIMVALDMDNNRVYFGKNGSWNDGDGNADEANLNDYAPVNGVTNAIAAFTNANGSATATAEFNFGNPPYANSSSVSDGNGFGNFEFAVPSGYFAICTKNLAEYG